MKKKSLYIIFTLSIIFLFNIKLDALTCTYEYKDNEFDANEAKKEITIDFSLNIDNQAYLNGKKESGLVIKSPFTTCINASNSTFKEIHLYDVVNGGKTGSFSYAGRNWTFNKDSFESSSCIMNINTYDESPDGNAIQKCPSLGFIERKVKDLNGKDITITQIVNKQKDVVCNNPTECKSLVPKNRNSQTIDTNTGEVKEEEYSKTCNYTFDTSNINGSKIEVKSHLTITESPKGTFWISIDGSEEVKLNSTGEYAFDIISKDLLSHIALKREHLQKFIIMSDPENGTGLICKTTPNPIYYDSTAGKYIVVPSKEDIPEEIIKNGDWTYGGQYGEYDPIYGQLRGGEVQSKSGLCVDYLGSVSDGEESLAYFLDQIYSVIKIVSILITIIWCMLDLTKVIIHNKDELMNMVKKCAIRLVILLIILLLPTFIDMIGNLFGKEDILCGIK